MLALRLHVTSKLVEQRSIAFYWQKTWKYFLHLRGRCVNSQPRLWIMTLFRHGTVVARFAKLWAGWPTDIYSTGIIQDKLGFRCISKFGNSNLCWQYNSHAVTSCFLYFPLPIDEETRSRSSLPVNAWFKSSLNVYFDNKKKKKITRLF